MEVEKLSNEVGCRWKTVNVGKKWQRGYVKKVQGIESVQGGEGIDTRWWIMDNGMSCEELYEKMLKQQYVEVG